MPYDSDAARSAINALTDAAGVARCESCTLDPDRVSTIPEVLPFPTPSWRLDLIEVSP
jgi:hypothetical protein